MYGHRDQTDLEVAMEAYASWLEQQREEQIVPPEADCRIGSVEPFYGGGGNRTRVRGRTGESVYKRSLRFAFARRPARRRPTAGLALLWSPASGEWLSLRGEPVDDAASRSTGRDRCDALPKG